MLKNSKAASVTTVGRFLIVLTVFFVIQSCEDRKELLQKEVYEGPLMDMDSIRTMMTDSGKIVIRLTAPKQQDFENGDRVWPEGLFLEYFDDEGRVQSTFKSNYAIKKAEENLYRGEGNVIVKNIENGDELNTEELFWDPEEEIFYTDKFVTILSDGEIHTGEGLEANQDFSSYRIMKPSGSLLLEEEF
jgi:LPS export ABC transporter protein LptC